MAVQLRGQSTWTEKAKADRAEQEQALYDEHKLRTDDTIRFPRHPGSSAWAEGKPIGLAADGSITCLADGKFRAVLPQRLEVKMTRGGSQWVPLIPQEDGP